MSGFTVSEWGGEHRWSGSFDSSQNGEVSLTVLKLKRTCTAYIGRPRDWNSAADFQAKFGMHNFMACLLTSVAMTRQKTRGCSRTEDQPLCSKEKYIVVKSKGGRGGTGKKRRTIE